MGSIPVRDSDFFSLFIFFIYFHFQFIYLFAIIKYNTTYCNYNNNNNNNNTFGRQSRKQFASLFHVRVMLNISSSY